MSSFNTIHNIESEIHSIALSHANEKAHKIATEKTINMVNNFLDSYFDTYIHEFKKIYRNTRESLLNMRSRPSE